MIDRGQSKKFSAEMIQYGKEYNIIGKQEDDLASAESKQHLTKAQTQAQKLLQDALIQVEQTIAQAQEEAANILKQAQTDAANIQIQAQEIGQKMGFDAGYQDGYNQATEEAQNIIRSAETIVNGAYQSQKEILMNTEKDMLALIIAISKKVINKELRMQPDIILRLTEAAIKELKEREVVKLIVNPQSVVILKNASNALKQRINSLEIIKIIEDKSVPIGGVIVESASGKIDAQIDTQLEEIYNRLLDEATNNPAFINVQEAKSLPAQKITNFINQQNVDTDQK